jgi:hypothetical protein
MIPAKVNANMLGFLLLASFFLTLNCASSKQIQPRNVYLDPNAEFSKYKRQAIFLDLNQLPEGRRELSLYSVFEEELQKLGYDVLGRREFFSFLKSEGYAIEEMPDPRVLSDIRNELKISAIMKVTVNRYEFEEKEKRVTRIEKLEPLTMEPVLNRIFVISEYTVDLSFVLDMIATAQGNQVWSCSISCEKEKVEEDRYKLIREMIKKCLRTIPHK